MKRLFAKMLTVLTLAVALAASCCGICVAESVSGTTIGESGDVLFYILVGALVIAVIAICIIFSRSEKFVIKERERVTELNKEIPPAKEIRVTDAEDAAGRADADGKKED